ncbi:hypothetical protein Pst134EA_004890 [Puccinia striiformis f. sp. tritici]|uniref:hypothetical protein n=1 Tax=Puccinia striiformis f. sp. tritici TaxID=168172 RepID=UPI002007B986|nr:hypothetical protein Pst134EA_004890 [Puccinia striiformis f. sp. tritici]KAH9470980.1 hypothetical protein Pst134EA_004890 [Puccinia striiformis f. sp. tritici]
MNAREEEEQAKLPFTWNQTLQHLGLNIPAPPRTKAHDLVMEISKTKLKVGLKGKEEILDSMLCKESKWGGSTRTLGGLVDRLKQRKIANHKKTMFNNQNMQMGKPAFDKQKKLKVSKVLLV